MFSFYPSVSGRYLPFLESCFQCMLISDVYNSDYLLWHLFKVVLFIQVTAQLRQNGRLVCWSALTVKEDFNDQWAKMLRN